MVRSDGRRFALPLAPGSELFRHEEARTRRVERWDVVESRGTELRLVHLDRRLGAAASGGPRHVVVAQVGDARYGTVVREVIGREAILVNPLGASLRGLARILSEQRRVGYECGRPIRSWWSPFH